MDELDEKNTAMMRKMDSVETSIKELTDHIMKGSSETVKHVSQANVQMPVTSSVHLHEMP